MLFSRYVKDAFKEFEPRSMERLTRRTAQMPSANLYYNCNKSIKHQVELPFYSSSYNNENHQIPNHFYGLAS